MFQSLRLKITKIANYLLQHVSFLTPVWLSNCCVGVVDQEYCLHNA